MPFGTIMCDVSSPALPYTKSLQSSDGCISQKGRKSHRRSRTIYTQEQINAIEVMFSSNQYPDFDSREAIGDAIGLSEARVQVRLASLRP